jgi:uncharacterized protein
MLRIVLDTNLFVSALLVPSGIPAQIIDAWRRQAFTLVISPPIIDEIKLTLTYPRIRRKYAVTDQDVQDLTKLLETEAWLVTGDCDLSGSLPADPKDEIILACALEGEADIIVSGDQHLLNLGKFKGIEIVTVRQLWDQINSTQS